MEEPRRFIQVVFGPRQVGKTTLVTQMTARLRQGFHFVSADEAGAGGMVWLEQQWEAARIKLAHEQADSYVLIIDEIQNIEHWSSVVKKLWDADSLQQLPLKVILLGSSRLMLQQGLTESLAGRFEVIYVGHWTLPEMQEAFGWTAQQYVWFGGYPGSADFIQDERRWKAYVLNALIEASISKDILMLNRIDKPALMKRLFELGCMYSGQILSFTKIMGQLTDAGNTTTLSHYLKLLDTAGLLAGIEKFAMDVVRKRSSSPKFQVHNTALISAQRSESFERVQGMPAEWGRLVESAIGAHLLHFSLTEHFHVYYWRHRQDEIDFVIEKNGRVIGIEVKSGAAGQTGAMAVFQEQMRPQKVLLVGSSGIPWQVFLTMNPAELF